VSPAIHDWRDLSSHHSRGLVRRDRLQIWVCWNSNTNLTWNRQQCLPVLVLQLPLWNECCVYISYGHHGVLHTMRCTASCGSHLQSSLLPHRDLWWQKIQKYKAKVGWILTQSFILLT
jgi:hypothetical protein